jgi:hypothetical protein
MLIKRKEKKIVVEAFAPNGTLIDLFPIERTENATPRWYQNLPGKPVDGLNVKQCPGAKDLFSKGLIIPLWADYEITLDAGGGGSIKSAMTGMNFPPADTHNLEFQAAGAWPEYGNIKFNSPWWLWCSEPIEWAWLPATWWQQDPQEIIPVPGIAEYRYQHITNINTLVKKSKISKVISLKAGTPMVQLIPLTERDWEFKLEVMTQEEIAKKFTKWEFSLNPRLTYQKIRNILEKKIR